MEDECLIDQKGTEGNACDAYHITFAFNSQAIIGIGH